MRKHELRNNYIIINILVVLHELVTTYMITNCLYGFSFIFLSFHELPHMTSLVKFC